MSAQELEILLAGWKVAVAHSRTLRWRREVAMVSFLVSFKRSFDDPVTSQSDRQADDAGAQKRRPEQLQSFPVEELCEVKFAQF